jgi:hypothetical protein
VETDARFVHTDPMGIVTAGEGKVSLNEDSLVTRPASGAARSMSYRDMVRIDAASYKLLISNTDGSKLELSAMGHRYEDVVRELHNGRNEQMVKDLLMGERLRKQGVRGELRSPFRGAEGSVEVRLYDTAVVLMPLRYGLVRVRYSDIRGIEAQNHMLRIELESGEQLTLAMLGRELDPLWKGISDAMAEIESNVQATVKDIFPEASGETLRDASRLLREARAARRQDLEDLSPRLFEALESRLRAAGLGNEYDHLMARGRKDLVRIGIKHSLSSKEDYIWFMVPLLSTNGNAVAMEATSGSDTGRATYFFRIASRGEYPGMDDEARFEAAEGCMDLLTAALQDINFRREPIYLGDDQLADPQYSKYRFSVILMPGLRELRHRFIGRVAHTSPEEWSTKVDDLLAFNGRAAGNARWTFSDDAGG